MKTFYTLLISLCINLCFGQFHRSYFQATKTTLFPNLYSFHFGENDQKYLSSVYIDSSQQMTITTLQLNDFGDVIASRNNIYTENWFIPNYQNMLLGTFDRNSNRYYIFKLLNGVNNNLVYLKTDLSSGNLLNLYIYPNTVAPGNMESKQVGNEIITYTTKSSGGLIRVAMNMDNFPSTTEEIVDNQIGVTQANASQGAKVGFLNFINGKEYYSTRTGNTWGTFIRQSANNYTSFTSNVSNGALQIISSFVVQGNQLVITNGKAINVFDANGNLIKSGNFLTNSSNTNTNFVFYKNSHYFISSLIPKKLIIADTNFLQVSSTSLNTSFLSITSTQEKNNKTYLLGNVIKLNGLDLNNESNEGRAVYLECFEDNPKLRTDEYIYYFQPKNSNLSLNVGLGSYFLNHTNVVGSRYDKSSLLYFSNDNYVGINSTTYDTIYSFSPMSPFYLKEEAGPYTYNNAFDEIQEAKYNRSYHVSRAMIENHLDSIQHGSPNYIPVRGIRDWPGNGDTTKGQPAVIAPFIDKNNNGIYEPMYGEYPRIYGDDCLFNVTHYRDNGKNNKKIEIHSFIYTFDCDSLKNVVFRKLNFISRGASLDQFYMGQYVDPDIGGAFDDYVGTNVDLGMIYGYNGTIFDNDYQGSYGFHDTLAAAGIMTLKGFKQTKDWIDNSFGVNFNESVNGYGFIDGIVDNECKGLEFSTAYFNAGPMCAIDPNSVQSSINNLNGLSICGDSLLYGSYWTTGGDSLTTKFIFPGNEDTYHYGTKGITPSFIPWAEWHTDISGGSNQPGDRRIFGSLGQTSLGLNDTISVDYALIAARDKTVSTSILSSVYLLFQKGWEVRNAFLANSTPCGGNFDGVPPTLNIKENPKDIDIKIFPSPTHDQFKIVGLHSSSFVEVYDLNGAKIMSYPNYQNGETIRFNDAKSGVYLIHIANQQSSIIKKIVKW